MEDNNFSKLKKVTIQILKSFAIKFGVILAIISMIFILIAGFIYFITNDDASYKKDDWSSTPYAVDENSNNANIDDDGNIYTQYTAQELWNKMIENGSRVDEYLDSPEELLKLMNAELITNFPDTRSNPDEPIDWDTLNKDINSTNTQGIIKFNRAKSDGTSTRITFVNSETYYEWIEAYNANGDEEALENVLNHFTIKEEISIQNNFSPDDITTEMSEAIVQASYSTASRGPGLCQSWVYWVYKNAGLNSIGYYTAYDAATKNIISTDMNNIPIGATVYGTGTGSAGHVGIYIGNGKIRDSITKNGQGYINESTIQEWLSWQTNTINGKTGWLGWGWQSGVKSQTVTENVQQSQEDTNTTNQTNEKITSLDNILFIGDSITVGLNNSGLIPNATFCAEVSTSPSDWVSRIDTLPENTDEIKGVCVMLGVNGTTGEIESMKKLIDLLEAKYSNKNIFVQKVLPVANTYTYIDYNTMNENIKKYNEAILSYCATKTNVKFIDTSEGYVDESGSAKSELFDSAGLHPTNYEILKENIEKAITGSTTGQTNQNVSTSSKYIVIVGTWEERYEEKVAEGEIDPEEEYIEANTVYTMATQSIDYQNMVKGYTMPFDYLWALVVTGREKDFPMELADLVYASEIEITIYDNYKKITDVDTYNYTRKTKVHTHDIKATIKYGHGPTINSSNTKIWKEGKTDEILKQYTTKHTIITTTNTLDISLTKADVWIVDYSKDYEYETPEEVINDSITQDLEKIEYPTQADKTDNEDPCNIAKNFGEEQLQSYSSYSYKTVSTTCISDYYYGFEGTVTNNNKIETKKYTSSPANIIEKTNVNSSEPNFVNIFMKQEYYRARNSILSAPDWLFEILENNEATVEMVDLTKYLFYKATGHSLDVTNFDFSIFEPENFSSIGGQYGTSGLDGVQGQIYDFLLSKGVTPAGAAAVLGNIEGESGFNPTATNGTHNGLCQWSKADRFKNLESYANSKGTDWSDVQTQIEFMWQELEGPYKNVKQVLIDSNDSSDLEYATWYFGRYFEVFFLGDNFETTKHYTSKRYEYAQKWYKAWDEKYNS